MKKLLFLFVLSAAAIFAAATPGRDSNQVASNEVPFVMNPFKVIAEMIELKPLLHAVALDPNRPLEKVTVVRAIKVESVMEGSPADKAGIKKGMWLVEIEGVSLIGKTEAQMVRDSAKAVLVAGNVINLKLRVSGEGIVKIPIKLSKPVAALASR